MSTWRGLRSRVCAAVLLFLFARPSDESAAKPGSPATSAPTNAGALATAPSAEASARADSPPAPPASSAAHLGELQQRDALPKNEGRIGTAGSGGAESLANAGNGVG